MTLNFVFLVALYRRLPGEGLVGVVADFWRRQTLAILQPKQTTNATRKMAL
jgi:hypothetical protein